MSSQQFDAIVIGSGQGGKPLSAALAQAGMRTALIERDHIGGTCVNTGCTPTKTMLASGRVAYLARRAADYGVCTGPISIDPQKVRQRGFERAAHCLHTVRATKAAVYQWMVEGWLIGRQRYSDLSWTARNR